MFEESNTDCVLMSSAYVFFQHRLIETMSHSFRVRDAWQPAIGNSTTVGH